MRVRVKDIEPRMGESVWTGVGTTDEGEEVRFAGDWRPMEDVWEALNLRSEDPVFVDIEGWQVIG